MKEVMERIYRYSGHKVKVAICIKDNTIRFLTRERFGRQLLVLGIDAYPERMSFREVCGRIKHMGITLDDLDVIEDYIRRKTGW